VVSLASLVPDAGMMVESPKRDRTVVFSPANNAVAIVNNAQESASSVVNLPGTSESMLVGSDNTTLFAAVPSAPMPGQAAGAVVLVDIASGRATATIPIAGARFLATSPAGNLILVTSDGANTVSVLNPSLIAQGNAALITLSGFDKPVGALFSADGSTAYVLNCGPECGGVAASLAVLNLTQSPPVITSQIPVPAATTAWLSGSTLYVAGTPPAPGANCQLNLCGALTALSVSTSGSLSVSSTQPITDGYHNQMLMAPNSQLFVGSKTCTNVTPSGTTAGRGCLSVLNTATGTVYTATRAGDVTGMEAIAKRTVVYVCEGGGLTIYDTASDLSGQGNQLVPESTQITIVGQALDVKLADF
jgi:DNA-binding beta-propeller fold protein YncE